MAGSLPFGCGQCMPCRINRARQWQWRQFLEATQHEHNAFITLTYNDDCLPRSGWLEPRDPTLFFKRLRKAVYPLSFRYYLVGEYGPTTYRPHYHLSLFGLSPFTRVNNTSFAEVVEQCWSMGYTYTVEFNHATARYVTGYVTKHLTDRKKGHVFKVPEYARMSLRPALGKAAMEALAVTLNGDYSDWITGDVPSELHLGKRRIPLGRYLRKVLRTEVGFTEDYQREVKDRISWELSVKMQSLLPNPTGDQTYKKIFLADIAGKLEQSEKRYEIYASRRSL